MDTATLQVLVFGGVVVLMAAFSCYLNLRPRDAQRGCACEESKTLL